eukprot:SAG31_NODE_2376_length_5841_cov_10.199060_6_plen_72_part_00
MDRCSPLKLQPYFTICTTDYRGSVEYHSFTNFARPWLENNVKVGNEAIKVTGKHQGELYFRSKFPQLVKPA